MMKTKKYHSTINELDFEILISRCLSVGDRYGAAALTELSERHDYELNQVWIWDRARRQKTLWIVRRATSCQSQ
jgi:hypothetical protein